MIMGKHRHILCAILLAAVSLPIRSQGTAEKVIPDEVFYLMPAFSDGYVYFRGQAPAQGKLNICAVDNSLRFLDGGGTELEAANPDNILRVKIDTVWFLRSRDVFYRMYPVSPDLGVALKRAVTILRDVKEGAYGMKDQISSIRQYSSLYTEGGVLMLNSGKPCPYDVTETLYLYKGEGVYPFTKKTLKKLFPARKEEIEAYFKAGGSLPGSADEAAAFLASWSL